MPPALLDMSSTTFRGSEEKTSASTSHTAVPVLAKGPSNDPDRVEPGNQVVLPPQYSSGDPETLSGPESSVQPGPLSSPGSSEQPRTICQSDN